MISDAIEKSLPSGCGSQRSIHLLWCNFPTIKLNFYDVPKQEMRKRFRWRELETEMTAIIVARQLKILTLRI